MPKVEYTDAKGLFQSTGNGFNIDTTSGETIVKQGSVEVARTRLATNLPGAAGTSTTITSLSTGLAYKKRVIAVGSGNNDNVYTLTAADSGAVIAITPTNNLVINLPLVGTNDIGMHFEFVMIAKANKSIEIRTSGTDDNDNFLMFQLISNSTQSNNCVNFDGAGDVLSLDNLGLGSQVHMTCVAGGAAEKWVTRVFSSDTVAATVAT